MRTEKQYDKPGPPVLERAVLSFIGVLSLIFVPFCFLCAWAMLSDIFDPTTHKYWINMFYSFSLGALFVVLGLLLAVAGWKLINTRQSQYNNLISTFFPWLRRVGWLFVGSFLLDGIWRMTHDKFGDGVILSIYAIVLAVIILRRHKIE